MTVCRHIIGIIPDAEPQRDALHGGAGALRTDYGIPVTLTGQLRWQRDLTLPSCMNAKTRAIPAFDTVARLDAIEYDVEEEQRGAHAGAEGGDVVVPTVSTAWGVEAIWCG
jgi:hypothetical protein